MKKFLVILAMTMLVIGLSAQTVTLKYANWNLGTAEENNIERQMIAAFMETHPNIVVKIDDRITGDWPAALAAAAAAGGLPDVFMLQTIPGALANDWVMDISALAKADKEYSTLPKVVSGATVYNGKTFAVPFALHMMGYFVNKDVFEGANAKAPTTAWKLADFTKIMKDYNQPASGVLPLSEEVQIVDWYASAANPKMGYFTWDGSKFNLNSKEFLEGIALAKSLWTAPAVWEAQPKDIKDKFPGGWHGEAWNNGNIALRWDGTWAVPDITKLAKFNWDFIGVPGGRTIIVNDYVGIANGTKRPAEAYEFAKWMSWGKEGFLKRLQLAAKANTLPSTLPMVTDKTVLDAYFKVQTVPGVKALYATLDKGVVEAFKWLPGYIPARWDGQVKAGQKIGDLLWNSVRGDVKVADVIDELNTLSNTKYKEAARKLGFIK
ncbi:MAG: extracellular solute-binding protein [Spirochaetales bacterium]